MLRLDLRIERRSDARDPAAAAIGAAPPRVPALRGRLGFATLALLPWLIVACFERGPLDAAGALEGADVESPGVGDSAGPGADVGWGDVRDAELTEGSDVAEVAAVSDAEVGMDSAGSVDVDAAQPEPDASGDGGDGDVDAGGAPNDAGSGVTDAGPTRACIVDGDCAGLVPGDLCAGPIRCIDYTCRPDSTQAIACYSDDPCVASTCEPSTGLCVETSVCSCEPALALGCGGEVRWSTNDPGLRPPLATSSCAVEPADAPVRLIAFEGRGRVRLEVNASVFRLHVLEAPEDPSTSDCRGADCLGAVASPERATYLDVGPARELTLALAEVGPNRLASIGAVCDIRSERWCADGLDDEGDGLVDCEDPDCADESVCLELCLDPGLVTWCWMPESHALSAGAGRSTHYGCGSGPQPGREHVFRFRPYYTETVRFAFSGSPGLSVFLLEDRGGGCRPRDCLATSGGDLWFDVVANATYYVVVDASHELGGSFDIDFDCNPLGPDDP